MMNYMKIQYVGNSDELMMIEKNITLNLKIRRIKV